MSDDELNKLVEGGVGDWFASPISRSRNKPLSYESCFSHSILCSDGNDWHVAARDQYFVWFDSMLDISDHRIFTLTFLQQRQMEVNEKNLLTKEEAEFIRGIMTTIVSKQGAIIDKKLELLKEHIEQHPLMGVVKEVFGKDQVESDLKEHVATSMRTKITSEITNNAVMAASIVSKLDSLSK